MAANRDRVSLTLREWRGAVMPFALWALVSVFLAMTGPFDTYAALDTLPRAAYWATVVALSIGVSRLVLYLVRGRGARGALAAGGMAAFLAAAGGAGADPEPDRL